MSDENVELSREPILPAQFLSDYPNYANENFVFEPTSTDVAYDAVELHGVAYTGERHIEKSITDKRCVEHVEMNDDKPDFYSVYLHLKAGGVDCIADFDDLVVARRYALEVSKLKGWSMYDYQP